MNAELPIPGTPEHWRISAIAKELSSYGLGIFAPHAHDERGTIVNLPSGTVALEQDLRVSFVEASKLPASSVPVGWRWNGVDIVVCAQCCGDGGPREEGGDPLE